MEILLLSFAAFIAQRAFALQLSVGFLAHFSVMIMQLVPLTSFHSFKNCLAKRRARLRPPMAVPKIVFNVINTDARF